MTRDEIADRARKLLIEHCESCGHEPPEITDDLQLVGTEDFDSLDFVEITMTIEDRFDVEIPDDVAEDLKTFKNVVDWLAKRLGSADQVVA